MSCSQSDELPNTNVNEQEGVTHTYKLHLNCGAPDFEGHVTRSTTSWASGSVLYFRFLKSGTSSTYITGKATYDGSSWSFQTNSTLTSTSSNTSCSAVYVVNPTSTNSSTITMSPTSAAYKGTGTYTCTSNDISVNISLSPVTARLRFMGSSGTRITLQGNNTDMKYVSSISLSTLEVTNEKSDASLTVGSSGYTPYVYGTMTYSSAINTLSIRNDSESREYARTKIEGTKLSIGSSGCLTIPTNSNYSLYGWIQSNAYKLGVTPDQLTVISCGASSNYSCDSDVYEFYAGFFTSSTLSGMDDDELKYYLKKNGIYFKNDELSYINKSAIVSSGTNMTLITLGIAKDGTEGNIYKKSFTIPTDAGQPQVSFSNYQIVSDNQVSYDITMNSYCSKYYLRSWADASYSILFAAWHMEKSINNGTLEALAYSSVKTTFSSVTKLTECSTFARGVSSSGKLSNVVNYITSGGSNGVKSRKQVETKDKEMPEPCYAPLVYNVSY